MKMFIAVLLTSVLTENYILSKYLGICPFLGVSKRTKTAVGMSLAITVVMVMSVLITWPVYMYLLDPNGLEYLQTIAFILIIATLVQFLEAIMKKYMPSLYASLGVYLPLITTNCAVLGIAVMVIQKTESGSFGFIESLVTALGSGLGYLLAMLLFSGIRIKMEHSNIPDFFKGMPITLIAAAILALAFFGFNGIAEGLTGVNL